MRILIDGRFWGLENAGLGRYTINLVEELGKIDKKNEYLLLLRKKYFNKLSFSNNWTPLLADFRHYSLIEQIKLPGLISSHKPDLVHFLHFNVPMFVKKPYIVTIHDMVIHKSKGFSATTLPFYLYYPKRILYKFVFRNAIFSSKRIIVPSVSVKNELIEYFKINPEKISVTYEGFNEIFGQETAALNKKSYFVYAGNAYPHKNLERLVEAAKYIKTNLVIVSARNVFVKRLEKLIKNQNAQEYVKILGFTSDKGLASLYRNSLGFVYPSLFEGFGLPGLEAMAAGTLVLASEIPVFKEVYKDAAFYFNPYDFSSIEKAMQDVIWMKDENRKEVIDKGKEFARRYSWAKMAKETLKIYEDSFGIRPGK